VFIRRVVHSPFGQVLKAIRDNESRAISLGYDISRYKLVAFVLSASLAGLAGSLKALVLGFVTLSDVQQSTSGEVSPDDAAGRHWDLLWADSWRGGGRYFAAYLSDIVGGWVTAIIGAIFVACVFSFRRGIVGELAALRLRR